MSSTVNAALDELRFRLAGGLHEPGDPAYEDTCTLFNAMIERRPRLVARASAPDDVIAALAYAREQGLEVAVRAGGHSVAGDCLVDDGLVIDVRGLRDLEIDPERRVARVGAGLTWGELDRATQEHGLATTGGRVSTTGVAGLTLGGGSGWLERKHGLACDNLLAVELVTADGQLVRADEHQHQDLLWAHRGGGGNFGVVTTLELQLHELGPEVLGGLLLYPAEQGRELLRFYRDVMLNAPDELDLAFIYLTGPPEPEVPGHLHGELIVAIAGMYAGPVDEGEDMLREIRAFGPPAADLFGPQPYADLQCSIDDPPGLRNWWTADYLSEMPDEAIDAIDARAQQLPRGAAQMLIAAWGGAVGRVGVEHSPLSGRDVTFVVHPFMLWEDPAEDERVIAHGRAYRDDLAPWISGATYLNFIGNEGTSRVRAGFAEGAYERLARVKAEWDPTNVFRRNQNIRPA